MVSSIAWSEADPVAAMIASTIDENDSEIHQVLFMNDEGILIKYEGKAIIFESM